MKLIGCLKFLTENKTMENTEKNLLENSSEIFENAFDYAAIGIALIAPDGRWLRVNQAICDIVGYSEKELLNLTFQDITHPDDLDTDLAFVNRLLNEEIKSYQMEKRYYHKQGNIVWVLLSVSIVKNSNGTAKFFISQIQDITKRIIAENNLKKALAEVKQLKKLLPMCSYCKSVRNDKDYWQTLEQYIKEHTEAQFSHSVCPNCFEAKVKPQLERFKEKVKTQK